MTDRVRVDRGDGKISNVATGKDLDDFKVLNPGAKVVGDRAPMAETTPQEDAATAALNAEPGTVSSRSTLAELKAFADEHEIDLAGATIKADILARIEAASGDEPEEAD